MSSNSEMFQQYFDRLNRKDDKIDKLESDIVSLHDQLKSKDQKILQLENRLKNSSQALPPAYSTTAPLASPPDFNASSSSRNSSGNSSMNSSVASGSSNANNTAKDSKNVQKLKKTNQNLTDQLKKKDQALSKKDAQIKELEKQVQEFEEFNVFEKDNKIKELEVQVTARNMALVALEKQIVEQKIKLSDFRKKRKMSLKGCNANHGIGFKLDLGVWRIFGIISCILALFNLILLLFITVKCERCKKLTNFNYLL